MTQFRYFRCDECGKILANIECAPNQLMYTLIANYDTSTDLGMIDEDSGSYKAHFCSQKCLTIYVQTKVKEHHDLPIVQDDNRPEQAHTYGEKWEDQERR